MTKLWPYVVRGFGGFHCWGGISGGLCVGIFDDGIMVAWKQIVRWEYRLSASVTGKGPA